MKHYLCLIGLAFLCYKATAQDTRYVSKVLPVSNFTTLETDFKNLHPCYSRTDTIITRYNSQTLCYITRYDFLRQQKQLFAVKTNLLYDVVSVLNIEIELPIKDKWSISGEYIFPWWQIEPSDFTMQIQAGQLGVNYWLGNRQDKEVLTGWHVGVFGGIGKYDIQLFDTDGEQGNFYSTGVCAGYSHKISKLFRLEYQLGIGAIFTKYKKYDKERDTKYGNIKVFRYPWETKRRTWIGPTRARVSLVWLINYNSKIKN
ncbi:MAG: DUF3575 domain-containing protein [Rikenellaceae bacterium]